MEQHWTHKRPGADLVHQYQYTLDMQTLHEKATKLTDPPPTLPYTHSQLSYRTYLSLVMKENTAQYSEHVAYWIMERACVHMHTRPKMGRSVLAKRKQRAAQRVKKRFKRKCAWSTFTISSPRYCYIVNLMP